MTSILDSSLAAVTGPIVWRRFPDVDVERYTETHVSRYPGTTGSQLGFGVLEVVALGVRGQQLPAHRVPADAGPNSSSA